MADDAGEQVLPHLSRPRSVTSPVATYWIWGTVAVTLVGLAGGLALSAQLPPAASAVSFQGANGLGWLMFMGSSVHVASTGCLSALPEARAVARRHRVRQRWIPLGLLGVSGAAAALVPSGALAWLLLVVLAWQYWHFQKQNFGIVALAAVSSGGGPFRVAERRALKGAGAAGVAGLVARPRLVGLPITSPLAHLWVLAPVTFSMAAGYGLVLAARHPWTAATVGPIAAYAMSMVFWIPMFLFTSPFAAVGGMTMAHGLQYLVLTGLVLKGGRHRGWDQLGWATSAALIGGAALSWASHLHGAPDPLRVLFGAYLAVLMTHFIIDAGMWRMREPEVRTFLASRVPWLCPPLVAPVPDGS